MKRKDDDGEYRDVQLGRVAAQIEAAGQRARKYCAMDFWRPYPKQREFFAAGKDHREVAQFAGSQLGKTEGAAYQMACHLTGVYPRGLARPCVHEADQGMGGRRKSEDDPRHLAKEAVR